MKRAGLLLLVSVLAACVPSHRPLLSVGPAGGVVEALGASIEVPPGAVDREVVLTIARDDNAPAPAAFLEVGSEFALGPAGTVFATPVTVQVPYDPARLAPGARETDVRLFTRSAGGPWEPLAGAVVRADTNRVAAPVGHFSAFRAGLPVGCAAGLTLCGTSCVDTAADPANCGACGYVCLPGQACIAGACAQACASVADCDDGRFCNGVEFCVAGLCQPGTPPSCDDGNPCTTDACDDVVGCASAPLAGCCAPGLVNCAGACVDASVDTSNCGACGNVCPKSTSCISGACACAPWLVFCATVCVDVSTDPNNCGGCGNVCMAGRACVAGVCV